MSDGRRLVNFLWCKKCVNCHTKETETPCCDCLETGGRDDGSERPVYFTEAPKGKKGDPVRFTPEEPFDPNKGLEDL